MHNTVTTVGRDADMPIYAVTCCVMRFFSDKQKILQRFFNYFICMAPSNGPCHKAVLQKYMNSGYPLKKINIKIPKEQARGDDSKEKLPEMI